jgi:hypothetical protein
MIRRKRGSRKWLKKRVAIRALKKTLDAERYNITVNAKLLLKFFDVNYGKNGVKPSYSKKFCYSELTKSYKKIKGE